MLWLVAPFVHTPPHPAPDARWEVTFARREEMTRAGAWCAWEAESLRYDGALIWGAEPPDEDPFCRAPFEASRWIDVLGEDGPYVSVRLTEWSCCPEREQITRCVTYDLRTGAPTTLEAYDPRFYAWRTKRLQRVLERKHGGGWTVEPTAFIVGNGHVRACVSRGDEGIEIALR